MARKALFIPISEIKRHLEINKRQDIKIIVSKILDSALAQRLKTKGKEVKQEQDLKGDVWKHTGINAANNVCESHDFLNDWIPQYGQTPFAIAFANEKATQDEHYHEKHWEIYFSEYPIEALYRSLEESEFCSQNLEHGGAMIFSPKTVHKMRLSGLTIVVEVPAVHGDKIYIKR
jgi:hypothetical protein